MDMRTCRRCHDIMELCECIYEGKEDPIEDWEPDPDVNEVWEDISDQPVDE